MADNKTNGSAATRNPASEVLERFGQAVTALRNPASETLEHFGQAFGSAAGLLTGLQAAQFLNCSVDTITRLRQSGALSFVRVGRQIRFRPQDLESYLSRHEQRASHEPAAA